MIETTIKDMKAAMVAVNQTKPSEVTIHTERDEVLLTATSKDSDLAVSSPVVAAEIGEETSVTVDRLRLGQALAAAKTGPVKVDSQLGEVRLHTDVGSFWLAKITEPIPEAPSFDTVNVTEFESLDPLVDAACVASLDESRPVLTCVNVDVLKRKARFAATDWFRLVRGETKSVLSSGDSSSILVRRKAVELAGRLLPGHARLSFSEGGGAFTADGTAAAVSFTTVEGKFPDTEALWPDVFRGTVSFDEKDLLRLLKAAARFSMDSRPVVLQPIGESVKFQLRDGGRLVFEASLPCDGVLKEPIAFNSEFLAEAVKMSGGTLDYIDSLKPAVIGGNHLLMPARL